MEQDSFHLSRAGGHENFIQMQISNGNDEDVDHEDRYRRKDRGEDHHLDGLSLETSSLHTSNLLTSSAGPCANKNI